MINESNYPVEHWTNRLGISLEQRGKGFVFTTFLSETDAAALMMFDGWNPSSQALNRFRGGILCKITYEFKNPEQEPQKEIDSLEQLKKEVDRVEEKSCEELTFDTKGMAYVALLPLYAAFSEEWEKECYEKNKHLVGELANSKIFNKARCYLTSRKWQQFDSVFVFQNGYSFSDRQITISIAFDKETLSFSFLDENGNNETDTFYVEESDWSYFVDFVGVMEQINDWQLKPNT